MKTWMISAFVGVRLKLPPAIRTESLLLVVKLQCIVVYLLVFSPLLSGRINLDSRISNLAELQQLGIQMEMQELPGPRHVRRIHFSAAVIAAGSDFSFRSMGFSVLERELDEEFSSKEAKVVGLRDAKRWAKEVRGASTEKRSLTFSVAEDELPNVYFVVQFNLPKAHEADIGVYYLLLKPLRDETKLQDLTR